MIRLLTLFALLISTQGSFAQDRIPPSPESVEEITDADAEETAQEEAEDVDPFTLDPAVAYEAFAAGNYARAFDLAIIFAGRDDVPSMRLVGQMFANGLGVDQDQAEAAAWFTLAAEAGDPQAAYLLATMKLDGVFIDRDETGAAALLSAAADIGHIPALQVLGMLHLEGRGVDRNLDVGADMIREAAQAGDITAQYTLGILYAEGAGVRQDTRASYDWFERAARRGNVEAQIEFALGLLNGRAADPNDSQEQTLENAIFWLRRAAEGHNPVAENRLAHAYAQGIGVRLDPVLAAYMHARAVSGGLADARLDTFVASLSEEQRTEAQALMARDRGPENPFDQEGN
ncbi:MAG: hypothetical protein Rhims3KO_17190 [Hyphomicrobiales bacterium]